MVWLVDRVIIIELFLCNTAVQLTVSSVPRHNDSVYRRTSPLSIDFKFRNPSVFIDLLDTINEKWLYLKKRKRLIMIDSSFNLSAQLATYTSSVGRITSRLRRKFKCFNLFSWMRTKPLMIRIELSTSKSCSVISDVWLGF